MDKTILIQSFPFPPSINEAYRNVPKVGRVSSAVLKEYKAEVERWRLANLTGLEAYKQMIAAEWGESPSFQIDAFLVCKPERIWTKQNKPKRFDVSNRIKCFEDQFCPLFGFDDRDVWSISMSKVMGERECVIVMLSATVPQTAVEVLDVLSVGSPKKVQ
jgi:Holliday junction resolvase RusA-like endonuclease